MTLTVPRGRRLLDLLEVMDTNSLEDLQQWLPTASLQDLATLLEIRADGAVPVEDLIDWAQPRTTTDWARVLLLTRSPVVVRALLAKVPYSAAEVIDLVRRTRYLRKRTDVAWYGALLKGYLDRFPHSLRAALGADLGRCGSQATRAAPGAVRPPGCLTGS